MTSLSACQCDRRTLPTMAPLDRCPARDGSPCAHRVGASGPRCGREDGPCPARGDYEQRSATTRRRGAFSYDRGDRTRVRRSAGRLLVGAGLGSKGAERAPWTLVPRTRSNLACRGRAAYARCHEFVSISGFRGTCFTRRLRFRRPCGAQQRRPSAARQLCRQHH